MASWDRQAKEPPKAYSHFTIYRDLGPDRTLAKTAHIAGVTESYVRQEAAQWNWTGRCDQWDAHVRAIHDRAFLTEAAKRGKERARAFSSLLDKCLRALDHVDVTDVPLEKIASAMKVAAEGMRLEEGLETQRFSMEVTDARAVLSRLPPEVRTPLLRALADGARTAGGGGLAGGVPLGLGDGDAD